MNLTLSDEQVAARLREMGVNEADICDIVGMPAPQPKTQDAPDDEFSANVDFLHNCFPAIPRHTIRIRLIETSNDLERATDLLLNHEAVKDESSPQLFERKRKKERKNQLKREKRQVQD